MQVHFQVSLIEDGSLEIAVRATALLEWSGGRRFLPVGGSLSTFSNLCVKGVMNVPGEVVCCNRGFISWQYRVRVPEFCVCSDGRLAGFSSGQVAFSPLNSLLLFPFPLLEGLPRIRIKTARGIISPEATSTTELAPNSWMRGLVFWGQFEASGNLRIPFRSPLPSASQKEGVRRIYLFLKGQFGFEPWAQVLHFLFPILPEVGPGGFGGTGLAGRGATVLVLPYDYYQMDHRGFLWLAAHEIAHLWIGVAVDAGEAELDWFFEGLPAFYALIALRECGGLTFSYFQKLVKIALARPGIALQEGFLAALVLEALFGQYKKVSLHDVIRPLIAEHYQTGIHLNRDCLQRAISGVSPRILPETFENLDAGTPRLRSRWLEAFSAIPKLSTPFHVPSELQPLFGTLLFTR